ncbi:hypothetical protein [Flammeovirga sp. OC4]|uniref:hypothetical protein n=1 Tax=Flammeovirga sp. OC4 TaxID=1382345 RepID=UPI0005C5D3BB|nr:hypothetical protein [Flammeovirga sp. OC4]
MKSKSFKKCWWCNSTEDLTREHKIKKTHFDYFYKKDEYKDIDLKLFKNEEDRSFIIQGPKSDFIKFPKFLCKVCNGSRSKPFDESYDDFFSYFFENEDEILKEKRIDLEKIYQNQWREKWILFKKYIVKHISCRLVEKGYSPTQNMLNFLNGNEKLKDVKVVLRLKPYANQLSLDFPPLSIGRLYHHENIINNEIEFTGWFTVKSLSIEYFVQKNISEATPRSNLLRLHTTDYNMFSNGLINRSNINEWQTIFEDYQFGSDSEWYHFYMKNVDPS